MLKASIIVNTFNRGSFLNESLRGLTELDYPDYEIIVVNGPSTDHTEQILAQWQGMIKLGQCPDANLSMSRNIGIEMASGDVIAFIDDDAVPHRRWLSALCQHYLNPKVGGVGGYTYDNTGTCFQAKKTLCDRYGNAFYPSDFFDERPLSNPGSPLYPSLLGTNCSYRHSALLDIRGFDNVFAYLLDETDVCLRLTDSGYKIVYEPSALVYHQFAPSHVRSQNRVPRTLYPSVVSKSYFICTHGSRFSAERAAEELSRYRTEILRSNKWLSDHAEVTLSHRASLDDDLAAGIRDGERLARRNYERCPQNGGNLDLDQPKREFMPAPYKKGLGIAFVSKAFPPHSEGGIARWTSMMARGLADLGHRVHVVTQASGPPTTVYSNGYWTHSVSEDESEVGALRAARQGIPPGLAGWCAAVLNTVKSLKSFDIDVVSFPIWDAEGALLLEDGDLPLVMSLHTTYALARPFKSEWTERPLFAHFHVDGVIAVETQLLNSLKVLLGNSQSIVRDIERQYGVAISEKTIVASHGTFPPEGIDESVIVSKLGKLNTPGDLTITYVGRFEARKGFDLVCDAFSELLDSLPEATFNFVGDHLDILPQGNIAHLAIEKLKSSHRVHFHGMVPRDVLDRHYLNSDVVVMPSRYESFGLVAIEAMAAATPVIALGAGGLAEVIEDGTDGFLLDPDTNSHDGICERVLLLARNPDLLLQMKKSARLSFLSKYTVDAMVREAERAYFAAAGRVQ